MYHYFYISSIRYSVSSRSYLLICFFLYKVFLVLLTSTSVSYFTKMTSNKNVFYIDLDDGFLLFFDSNILKVLLDSFLKAPLCSIEYLCD